MAQLTLNSVDATLFTPDLQRRMLVAEHSDLRNVSLQQPLYDDACDVGIALYNPRTHALTRWHFVREERDGEGELQVTIFHPTPESLRNYPQLSGWSIHVLND
jgi:hypothetical protein